jgi:hypothetical protein
VIQGSGLFIVYPNCSLFFLTFGQNNDSYRCDQSVCFRSCSVWWIAQVGLVDSVEVFDMIGIEGCGVNWSVTFKVHSIVFCFPIGRIVGWRQFG